MKIQQISAQGFQGINYLDLKLVAPVLLVSGDNNSGKTSLRDTIRFALSGVSDRVSLKKDYPQLVHEGIDRKKAKVTVKADGVVYSRSVATGKGPDGMPDFPAMFPFLDGSRKFAEADRKAKQSVLTDMVGLKISPKKVIGMLTDRGIDEAYRAQVSPMLRAGFDAAHKTAKGRQAESRGAWMGLTGERYGELKAPSWKAPIAEPDQEQIDKLEVALKTAKTDLANITKKVNDGTEALQTAANKQGTKTKCPCCNEWLWVQNGKLSKDSGAVTLPPGIQEKMKLAVHDAKKVQSGLQQTVNETEQQLAVLNAVHDEEAAAKVTADALEYHEQVEAWSNVCDALSPSGVPLELMNEAIGPVNEHLVKTAQMTGWDQVSIRSDLEVEVGGRAYGLLSESEQWRADIALAEVISLMSGVGLFIMDRFDCLSIKNRGSCLNWVTHIANAKHHDTIIILGTLKALPPKFPPGVEGLWLEYGKQKVAA